MKGKFAGDLHVELSQSSLEPRYPYRVRVWVWRTNSRGETGWFESFDGLRDHPEFGGFAPDRRFRSADKALRYYAGVRGERARRRAGKKMCALRGTGWERVA